MTPASSNNQTTDELQRDSESLRERLREVEETLAAIRRGEVDSLVAQTPEGSRIFTLVDAYTPYRTFVEEMPHGAATLGPDGTILYCNHGLSALLRTPIERVVGAVWHTLVADECANESRRLLDQAARGTARAELHLRASDGTHVPVEVSANSPSVKGIGSTCLVVTDWTERKRAEASARQLTAILESTEEALVRRARDLLVAPAKGRLPDHEAEHGQRDERFRKAAALVASIASTLVMATGLLVLIGWWFEITGLEGVFVGMLSMKPNTALAFLFAGAACLMATRPGNTAPLLRCRSGAAAAVIVLGALTLAEWWLGLDLGIDQVLFRDDGTPYPGRMAPWAAMNFVILGVALLLLDVGGAIGRSTSQTLALLGCLSALGGFLGYTFGVPQLNGLSAHAAIHTDVAFGMLAVGVLSARAGREWVRSALKDYGVALLAVALAFLVRWLSWDLLDGEIPFLLHWPAVIVAAWYGGYRAGVLATLLSAVGTAFFILEPRWSLAIVNKGEQVGVVFFLFIGTGVSLLVEHFKEVERTRVAIESEIAAIRAVSVYNRSLIEASLDPLVTIGPDGLITDLNAATGLITGKTRAELIGTRFDSYFTEPERARAGYEQAFRDGTVRDQALEIRHRDGHTTPVHYNASIYRDATGNVLGLCGAARDISERKHAEQALRRSEENLRRAQGVGRIGSWHLDMGRDELTWTDETYRIFGIPPGTPTTYEAFLALVHPEDRALVDQAWIAATKGDPFDIEHRIQVGGQVRWVREKADVEIGADGSPTEGIGIAQDVTERKQAEIALKESETAFRLLAEAVPQLVWMCQADGLNTYFNQRWVDYTGMTLEESHGRGWNTPFHPDDKQPAWKAWNQAVATGEEYRIECRLRAANGNYRWFLTKGVPLRDTQGTIVKWFGTCTDIDDLKQAQKELHVLNAVLELRVQERTAQLEASNKELEAFAYSVSHDLRAPLRAIDGFSQILLREYRHGLPEKPRHYLEVISDNARQMGRLIDDLLRFSRTSRQPLKTQRTAMVRLVEQCQEELQAEHQGRKVEFSIGELPDCQGDPALLKQVWLNLLSNALKFTRQRDVARIEVGSQERNGEMVYHVRDNGVGFDMRYADKLFGVFQRLHRAEEFEGTGIGLALVQRILHRHGGQAWAEAVLDQGATIYFTAGRSAPDA